MRSKSGQELSRYFPEIVSAARSLRAKSFVLDGEIVVPIDGQFSFDDLLQRIHPAASRVRKLASETPAMYLAFDLLKAGRERRWRRNHCPRVGPYWKNSRSAGFRMRRYFGSRLPARTERRSGLAGFGGRR